MDRTRRLPDLLTAIIPAIAVVLLVAVAPGVSIAGTGDDTKDDARRLLDEVARVYRALPAYADHGVLVLSVEVEGTTHTTKVPASIALARPNRLRVDAGPALLFCDGTTLTTVVGPSKKYATEPAPKRVDFQTVAGGPVGSLLFGGPGGPALRMVVGLLLDDDPARAVLDQGQALTVESDRVFEGETCQVLRVGSASGTTYVLRIDPTTRLLRAIDIEPDAQAISGLFPSGSKVKIATYRWIAGPTSTEPPVAEVFAAELPKDFARLGAPDQADRPDDNGPRFQVQKLIDKPAPDFALTVLDGPGKTRTLSRGDLAGKVVVIDFWATWCGPCLDELPEVQKLIESYARNDKKVVFVALSQDDEPNDPVEVRKLIEKTLKEQKLDLVRDPVGKVGLDPSHAIGEAFQVEGYPTVVILDAKGIVRAAHVGNSPDVGKVLRREVDALLDGKPVPREDETRR